MARNEEKQICGLNRFVIAKERDLHGDSIRPHLEKLHDVESIRKWIPDIKAEIDYCIKQIEGTRGYTDAKIQEFKLQVDELEAEYKRFVKKALELDPNPMWIPGERHSYVSKKTFELTRLAREQGEEMVNFNEANNIKHTPNPKKRGFIPGFLQPSLQKKSNEIRKDESLDDNYDIDLTGEIEGNNIDVNSINLEEQHCDSDQSNDSDFTIETPLAFTADNIKKQKEMIEDIPAATNKVELRRYFKSDCMKYYDKSRN